MPSFRTTYNILVKPWEDELWNPNWMDSDKIQLPPSKEWDYSREMDIPDVDIWEVIFQGSNGFGVYAAWQPYAEYYMITSGWDKSGSVMVETHYGPGAQEEVKKRCLELNIPLQTNKLWVEPEDMWLYKKNSDPNTAIFI